MVDATDLQRLISEGDYSQALGITSWARRLDIETASARLCDDNPALAGVLSGITQVVVNPERKEIHEIACQFRDAVVQIVTERYGRDFLRAAPNLREIAWLECQQILRCDFQKNDIKIGTEAAESLLKQGLEWVVEATVNDCLPVYRPSDEDRRRGYVRITIAAASCPHCQSNRWRPCAECAGSGRAQIAAETEILTLADDLDPKLDEWTSIPCSACNGSGRILCDCQDIYLIQIPAGALPGSMISGFGERTRRQGYLLLDRKVSSPRPSLALGTLYLMANFGQDMSLDSVESTVKTIPWIIGALLIGVGALGGGLLGSWLIGAIVGLILTLGFTSSSSTLSNNWNPKSGRARLITSTMAALLAGAILGHFTTTWLRGTLISIVIIVVLTAFFAGLYFVWQRIQSSWGNKI